MKEDAEDLTANTFVKALTTFHSGNIQSWMYKVLRNEFLDLQKKRKHEVVSDKELLEAVSASESTYKIYLKNEQLNWLYQEISRLPGLEREVMLLTIQTDYKDSQISEILGITINNVRVLRHRAKARILKASQEGQT